MPWRRDTPPSRNPRPGRKIAGCARGSGLERRGGILPLGVFLRTHVLRPERFPGLPPGRIASMGHSDAPPHVGILPMFGKIGPFLPNIGKTGGRPRGWLRRRRPAGACGTGAGGRTSLRKQGFPAARGVPGFRWAGNRGKSRSGCGITEKRAICDSFRGNQGYMMIYYLIYHIKQNMNKSYLHNSRHFILLASKN